MAQRVKVDNGPLHGLWAITNRELKKWYKNYVLLAMSLVQPILWLGLFGKSMNLGSLFTANALNIPGLNIPKSVIDAFGAAVMKSTFGTSSYFSFLAVGMLAFIVLFTSMQSGMSIVWDRRLGFLSKIMTTSVPRGNIIVGKALSSVLKSLAQATIVLIIATLLGLQYRSGVNVLDFVGMYVALFLMSLGLSSIFLMLALRSTSWESQMAIMNLLNMPLLFASNAFYPVSLMPGWLKPVVEVNPISYANDIDRQLLLGSTGMNSLAFDFAFLAGFAVVFTAISMYMSWKYLTK
ncbi:ABC transporter permease [Tardisphaera saccharovorans]